MNIKDIIGLNRDDLLKTDRAFEIIAEGGRIIAGRIGYEARDLAKLLTEKLQFPSFQSSAPLSSQELEYKKIISILRVIAFPFLLDGEVVDIFKTDFVGILKFADFDLDDFKSLLKQKLLMFPVTSRDLFKQQLRKALHENQEFLTRKYANTNGTESLGAVNSWLNDYIKTIKGGEATTLQQAEYLSKLKVDADEKFTVRKLIQLYEYLKLSSLTPQGIEEAIIGFDYARGKHYMINKDGLAEEVKGLPLPNGSFVPTPSVTLPASDLLALADKEINNAMVALRSKSGNNLETVVRALYDNLFPLPGTSYDRSIVIGALGVLAQEGWLLRALEEHNPIRGAFVQYLGEEKRTADIESFKLSPTSPLSLGRFLRFVLVRRLRMDESKAASFAARIGNILKEKGRPEYFGLAYFDQADGAFKWRG